MAMKGVHKAQTNLTHHADQPTSKKLFTETDQNSRSVPAFHKAKGGQQKLKEGNLTANASQPSGKSIGYTTGQQGSKVPNVRGASGNSGGIFKTRGSVLKNSGVSGAHRLGCKK
jgi:hypothetical protein